jgi:hypothetical protein
MPVPTVVGAAQASSLAGTVCGRGRAGGSSKTPGLCGWRGDPHEVVRLILTDVPELFLDLLSASRSFSMLDGWPGWW